MNKSDTLPATRSNRKNFERAFPKEYIANGLNAKRAYKALKGSVTDGTAEVGGSRMLSKPSVQKSIQELLRPVERDIELIHEALEAETPKAMEWRDKHKFIETSLKLRGLLQNNTPNTNVQVNMVLNNKENKA